MIKIDTDFVRIFNVTVLGNENVYIETKFHPETLFEIQHYIILKQ